MPPRDRTWAGSRWSGRRSLRCSFRAWSLSRPRARRRRQTGIFGGPIRTPRVRLAAPARAPTGRACRRCRRAGRRGRCRASRAGRGAARGRPGRAAPARPAGPCRRRRAHAAAEGSCPWGSPWVLLGWGGGGGHGPPGLRRLLGLGALVARPRAGELGDAMARAVVGEAADEAEDRALDKERRDQLHEAARLAVLRVGRLVLVDQAPDLLEDLAPNDAGNEAEHDA